MQGLLRAVAVPAVVTTTLLVLLAPGTTVASSGGAPIGRDGNTGMTVKFTEEVVGLT